MDNIFVEEQYGEDNSSSSSEEEFNRPNDTFMNMTTIKEFETNQRLLFNRDILKKNIVIDSHNYFQGNNGEGKSFNTSNYTILFDLKEGNSDNYDTGITTNYDIFKNVIGFRLLKATIRTPPYNVNSTNNVIKYRRTNNERGEKGGGGQRNIDEILTITINPGVYDPEDLANVFQQFDGYYDNNINPNLDERRNEVSKKNTHYVTYSDPEIGSKIFNFNSSATSENKIWKPWIPVSQAPSDNDGYPYSNITHNTFKVTFIDSNQKLNNVTETEYPYNGPLLNGVCSGMRFLFELNSYKKPVYINENEENLWIQDEQFEILWDYDSVTRGAARLFGFSPIKIRSYDKQLVSNKMPNFDSQYVDLVIPEIPSKACKKNSSGREIIERIQLKEGHGEYLHYKTPNDGIEQQYFNPMKLHRLTTQLWAVNNVLYDNDNSDVSYEFEITMVNNKKLLV